MKRLGLNVLSVLVALLFGGSSAMPSAVASEKIVMNVGWDTPLDSVYGILTKKFKELTEKYTNGTVEVKLRCCGQIGSEDNAFAAMQLGTVDAYVVTQNNVSPHWPLMDVFVLPYIFEDQTQLHNVIKGKIGQKIRNMLYKDTNVHLLTYGAPSYRDMYDTKRPIKAFKDFSGLKFRVPKNNVMIATVRAFGAEPVPLAWSDTPSALQTGAIDAADNGTSVIKEMKFYEFAKYLTILDHFVSVSPLFASDRFMNKLNDDQRAEIAKAAEEAGAYQTKITAKQTDEIRRWLHDNGGMEITYPDKAPFIAAARKVQDEVAADRGPQFHELLEEVRTVAK